MDWLEPNWSQEKPTQSDVDKMWRELEISYEPAHHEAVAELLTQLAEIFSNGGAVFAQFRVSPHPIFHWFASRNRLWEMNFFQRFLSSGPVMAAIPELEVDEERIGDFEWGNSLTLDGELAWLLAMGGPYHRFSGTAREAKNLAGRFCEALFADRFLEIQVHTSHAQWSPWFHGIAWDATWLGLDKRYSKVWMLCVTDTD